MRYPLVLAPRPPLPKESDLTLWCQRWEPNMLRWVSSWKGVETFGSVCFCRYVVLQGCGRRVSWSTRDEKVSHVLKSLLKKYKGEGSRKSNRERDRKESGKGGGRRGRDRPPVWDLDRSDEPVSGPPLDSTSITSHLVPLSRDVLACGPLAPRNDALGTEPWVSLRWMKKNCREYGQGAPRSSTPLEPQSEKDPSTLPPGCTTSRPSALGRGCGSGDARTAAAGGWRVGFEDGLPL